MNLQRLICTLFMITTMALAGCGGGGGGDRCPCDGDPNATPTPDGGSMPSVSVFGGDLNTTQEVADNIVTAIGKAARPRPVQAASRNRRMWTVVASRPIRWTFTAEYGAIGAAVPRFSVRNGTEWSIGMGEGNPSPISDTTPPWKGAELSKRVSGGTVYVEAYTDIEAPEDRQWNL